MTGDGLTAGMRLREQRDWQAAIGAFNRVIDEEGPDEAEAWFWLAATWEDTADRRTAVDAYRIAIETGLDDEMHVTAHIWLARALLAVRRPTEALHALDAVHELVEGESELDDLAYQVRRRAHRAAWVLPIRPGRYLTRAEVVAAACGLLCLAGTFLPWIAVHDHDPGFAGSPAHDSWQLASLWQANPWTAIPISVSALVLAVHLFQLRDRAAFELPCAVASTAMSMIAFVALLREAIGIYAANRGARYLFPGLSDPSVWPHVGFFLACVVLFIQTATTVSTLIHVRAWAAGSPAHIG